MHFKDLSLIEPLLRALQTEGYERPTPIQQQAIPVVLQGRDLLGCAQTGTGKTAAFSLPILQLLSQTQSQPREKGHARPIRTLILTPTRELAIQIGESIAAYGRNTHIKHTVIFGGVGQTPQTDALKRGVDILVATPGRLLDLIQQRHVSLRELEIFVLDEADRMLDMGFIHDVRKVIAQLPAKRQTLFFSATMPTEIAQLANSILTNPAKVEVTPVSSTAEKVEQCVYFVEKNNKKNLLIHLLNDAEIRSVLVFTRTKHGADRLAKDLIKSNIKAAAIHGNKSQNARQDALSNFKSGKMRVLVATDIAARGIDIEELSHVVNYELPNIPETYVHRIGRTGRAGASGQAISFCDAEEWEYLRDIQKLTGMAVPVIREQPYPLDLEAPELLRPGQRAQQKAPAKPQPQPQPARQRQEHPQRQQQQQRSAKQQPQQDRRQPSSLQPNPNKSVALAQQQTANNAPAKQQQQPKTQQQQPQQQQNKQQQHAKPQQQPQKNKPDHQQRSGNQQQQQKPAPKPQRQHEQETTSAFSDRRSRFSSILEVSAIEKQDFQRKPKTREFEPREKSNKPPQGGKRRR
ncbi:MAG: DEAD/DEAH box helicase [Saprospiraceae bacterium]|nr:DEAD/DEAH box helicase [Saprospiraceae bacterium]